MGEHHATKVFVSYSRKDRAFVGILSRLWRLQTISRSSAIRMTSFPRRNGKAASNS
jgi:hypothetical protein